MKWIAVGLNLLLILTLGYLFATRSGPGKDEIFFVIVLFAAPISSLVALFINGGESWMRLYFRRKVIEEKKKIAMLEKTGDTK